VGKGEGCRLRLALTPFDTRTLRESVAFAEQRALLVPDARAWDEIWFALDATIAADPTVGEQVDDTAFWLITTERAAAWGLPRMRVLYTFDDEFVDLLELDLAE
jgi:hypothetical protein